jgi:hypothetical protein
MYGVLTMLRIVDIFYTSAIYASFSEMPEPMLQTTGTTLLYVGQLF